MADQVVYNNGRPASERDAECTMDRLNHRDCEAVREEARRRIQQLDPNWDLTSVEGIQGDCRSVIDDYGWRIKKANKPTFSHLAKLTHFCSLVFRPVARIIFAI